MRIIAGQWGGRRLFMDDRAPVRPTSDKARGAVFSSIATRVEGAIFLDVFAGSGAVGLEALSRGAAFVVAVEKNPRSISLLQKNLQSLGVDHSSHKILVGDYARSLADLAGHFSFDVIFADPPYADGLALKALDLFESLSLLKKDGIIIVEHFGKEALPEAVGRLIRVKEKTYGQTKMSFYSY